MPHFDPLYATFHHFIRIFKPIYTNVHFFQCYQ